MDKHRGATEVTRLYAPQRPFREFELSRQQSTPESTNGTPQIHFPRPSYETPHPQGPHHTQGLTQPSQTQTLPRHTQKLPSSKVPSSSLPSFLPSESNEPGPFMLHRKINGPVGQAPRNQPTFMRTDDPQMLPINVDLMKGKARGVGRTGLWKQKFHQYV